VQRRERSVVDPVFRTVCWFSFTMRAMSATVRKSSPLAFHRTSKRSRVRSSGLQPVPIPAEVQGPELLAGLADQVALADQDLLSAVELDVLTTFAAKRSPKLPPRCELFIHGRSSKTGSRVNAG
jgi:hypothetical protein